MAIYTTDDSENITILFRVEWVVRLVNQLDNKLFMKRKNDKT